MDPELADALAVIKADLAALKAALDEYLPLVKVYLDPDAGGPRGWYLKRQLAKQNGAG